jgi:UDP-N-acetylmuramoylalanine--D-glutamate ligase
MVLQRRIEGGLWPDHVVLECSSFQLETLPAVPTAVGIVLNVTPDHMDRYPTIDAYAQTKARVFAGVGSGDLALLDADDPWTDRIAPTGPRLTRIGHDGDARIEGSGTGERLVLGSSEAYPRDLLRLPGRHNAKNALFALAAARHLGVSASDCRNGLRGFEGLPHRMTLVRHLDGVNYYNDSKATNVASALASLGGLAEPFVLIAGGRGKGDDLTPLRALLAARGRGLVAVGETAEQFQTIGNGVVPTQRAADMNEAVTLARVMARSGDAVVLAPACASYDQFRSYAHRGEVFTAAVNALR